MKLFALFAVLLAVAHAKTSKKKQCELDSAALDECYSNGYSSKKIVCPSGKGNPSKDEKKACDNLVKAVKKCGYKCPKSAPEPCLAGSYMTKDGCVKCASGKTSPAGSTKERHCDWIPCEAGSYLSSYGCVACKEGQTSPEASTSVDDCNWIPCDADYYLSSNGCVPCSEGQYSLQGSTAEEDCQWLPCIAGTYLTDYGCIQCEENSYSADNATVCTPCTLGKTGPAGSVSGDDCEWDHSIKTIRNPKHVPLVLPQHGTRFYLTMPYPEDIPVHDLAGGHAEPIYRVNYVPIDVLSHHDNDKPIRENYFRCTTQHLPLKRRNLPLYRVGRIPMYGDVVIHDEDHDHEDDEA